jgi:hypothetical protein
VDGSRSVVATEFVRNIPVNVRILPTVDSAKRPWPTIITLAVGFSRSGSAWLGRSQKDGLPSYRGSNDITVQGRRLALKGQPSRCPFPIGGRELSVLCAMFAWAGDRDVVGSFFFALGAVAILGAGYAQQR